MKFLSLTGLASGLATVLALSGCASHETGAPPSAFGRSPVNTPAAIAAFQAGSIGQGQAANLDTRMERRVDDLSRQVGELKAYLVMLQAAQESKGLTAAGQGSPPKHLKSSVAAPALSLGIGHDEGISRFSLDPAQSDALIAAAKASDHITVRGRSDGNRLTPQAKALAIDRATRVKAFLVSQGVPSEKIRITYCTQGCQIANGGSADAQRLNRQTRLEFRGNVIGAAVLAAKG